MVFGKVKRKILIVEDDIPLRDMYEERLKMEDFDVSVATDGEEGLAKTTEEKPDLIILDLMMPKISGMDVLDILKSTSKTKDIPVIVLTALTTSKTKSLVYGAEDYLVKAESSLEDIVAKVKEVVAKYYKE